MPSRNKTLYSLNCPQKPFSFIGVNCVLKILLMRDNFQVIQPIVGAVKVFVIYLQSSLNPTIKRLPHHAMHAAPSVFSVFAKAGDKIMFQQLRLNQPVSSNTAPRPALLDRMRRGYAGSQKLSNLFKGSAVFKHLLGFGNFNGVKRFTSGNAPHVSKVADLVQTFKIQNWRPRFHTMPLFNVNRSIA